MGEPGGKRASYEDVLNAPPHVVAEVIDGVLSTHPRPASLHAQAATILGEELGPPATQRHDRRRKMPLYRREGVTHVWIVEPLARTLEIYALDGATYRLLATYADEEKVRAPPFDAIELDLSVLWMR